MVAEEPLTLQELGDEFGVSRERVRQLEARISGKLRVFLKESLGDDFQVDAEPERGGERPAPPHGPRDRMTPDSTGCLFVVSTPIGNLGDITRRAVEVLSQVPCVVAEDTAARARCCRPSPSRTKMCAR
jgi:hypothetical protein